MSARAPVSATIITLNEAANIEAALASVAFCDERLVVDCGSKDGTVERARELGAKVIHHPWPGHVAQKNYAVDQAAHEWILSIDADERITPQLREEIEATLASPQCDAYAMPRLNFYLGRWIRHSGWYPDAKIRLFRKSNGRWGGENPHDRVEVKGKAGRLRGDLQHYPYRDLAHNIDTVNRYTTIAAAERFNKDRRVGLLRLLAEPPLVIMKKYLLQLGFLDGWPGLVIAATSGYYVFAKHAKLRELWRQSETK